MKIWSNSGPTADAALEALEERERIRAPDEDPVSIITGYRRTAGRLEPDDIETAAQILLAIEELEEWTPESSTYPETR